MTMKNVTFSTCLTVVMLVIFTSMVGLSFGFPAKARFMPLVVGVPGIALCLIQLAVDLFRSPAAPAAASVGQAIAAASSPESGNDEAELPEFGPHTARQELVMAAYFVSFIAGVVAFGFYISVPIMLMTFLKRQAECSWKVSVAAAAAATLVLYLVFGRVLGIELHPGLVTPWVLHSLGVNAI